jgi:DsbC/DsbD-like thiol-disulfide interchange protein
MRFLIQLTLAAALLLVPANFFATTLPQAAPDIGVNARLASEKVKKGGTVQGTVVMDIPSGYHVNSNRPREKYLIASQLQFEAPAGVRVSPILYPRPNLRSLKFSKSKVSVFEGHTTIRFTVAVPASFKSNSIELKGRLRYQACSDDVCFQPKTNEFKLWLKVE